MEWRQDGHVVSREDVERLVGEIRGHEPPQGLDHGTGCITVEVGWQPGARKGVWSRA